MVSITPLSSQDQAPKVLIVTHHQDQLSGNLVANKLKERGAEPIFLFTDLYPTGVSLTSSFEQGTRQVFLEYEGQSHDLTQLTAVWYRRFRVAETLPEGMPAQYRQAAVEESRRALIGELATIPAFSLDPFQTVRRAAIKQLQLAVADRLGIKIPRTTVTNHPDRAKAFISSCPSGAIVKMQSSPAVYDQGELKAVPTSSIDQEHFDQLEQLTLCPMVFQEKIPKKYELRVVFIGMKSFAAKIDSNRLPDGEVDWRNNALTSMDQWEPYELPEKIHLKLNQLMNFFGLNYGGIDIIVTPDDEYIFLEVNPGGEFYWLEKYAQLPLSDAFADVLLGQAPRRHSVNQWDEVLKL